MIRMDFTFKISYIRYICKWENTRNLTWNLIATLRWSRKWLRYFDIENVALYCRYHYTKSLCVWYLTWSVLLVHQNIGIFQFLKLCDIIFTIYSICTVIYEYTNLCWVMFTHNPDSKKRWKITHDIKICHMSFVGIFFFFLYESKKIECV